MIFEKLILKIILIQNIFYIFYFQLCTSLREMGLKKFLFIVETQCRLTIFIEISKIQVLSLKYQKYGFLCVWNIKNTGFYVWNIKNTGVYYSLCIYLQTWLILFSFFAYFLSLNDRNSFISITVVCFLVWFFLIQNVSPNYCLPENRHILLSLWLIIRICLFYEPSKRVVEGVLVCFLFKWSLYHI